jgi:formylglycine-generating enzyme required for sulfatase activity
MPELITKKHKNTVNYFEQSLHPSNLIVKPMKMMLILGGTFQMGSLETEIDRSERESPQHSVTVSSFFMSEYPIAQAHWATVAQSQPIDINLEVSPAHFKGVDLPVEQINWFEALEFCRRLSRDSGRTYRLPTESEWEYACRAGTITPFHLGKIITDELVNYSGSEHGSSEFKAEKATTPVNAFHPNAFGLYDMHGNVSEWCLDHWHNNYQDAPSNGSPWIDLNDANLRVVRGGCKHNLARNCRSATRSFDVRTYKGNDIGFRVVCEIPKTV